jgi:hypothetical protein
MILHRGEGTLSVGCQLEKEIFVKLQKIKYFRDYFIKKQITTYIRIIAQFCKYSTI